MYIFAVYSQANWYLSQEYSFRDFPIIGLTLQNQQVLIFYYIILPSYFWNNSIAKRFESSNVRQLSFKYYVTGLRDEVHITNNPACAYSYALFGLEYICDQCAFQGINPIECRDISLNISCRVRKPV